MQHRVAVYDFRDFAFCFVCYKVKVGFEGFYNYKLLKIESMSLKPSFRSSQPVDGAQDRCEGNRQGLAEAACC